MANRVGQQLGNYRLIRVLGEGGFAEVYLAEHVHLDTQAAIKVLHTQLADKDTTAYFYQEARLIAQLKHPHIVRTLDFGVTDSTPFLVMDYAPQGTLRQCYPKGNKVPLATIVTYVEQIAEGLQYAHEQKIVHRDIKPENMLIGRRGEILLSDFGIAVIAHSTRSQGVENLAGTIPYMSPEQIQGKPRPASDQYALGIIVYEWLCGERPFKGTFTEIATQHATAMPLALRGRMHISQEIEQVIFKALAKDPAQRFACVKDFAAALQQAYKAEYSATQRVDSSYSLRNSTPVQLKLEERPIVSLSPERTLANHLPPTVAATPPASLSTPFIPPPPPITKRPPQPRRKPKLPAVLPLWRGKLKFADLFVVLGFCGFCGLLLLSMLLFGYFYSIGLTGLGIVGMSLFAALMCTMLPLAGPLLGSIRGALATLLFCVGSIIYAQSQSGTGIYSYPQTFWVPTSLIAITFIIGWIYEKRKMRNFMLSWGILALESTIILVLITTSSSNSNTQSSDVITGFIILSPIIGVIIAAVEAIIQAIVVSILKKKRQA